MNQGYLAVAVEESAGYRIGDVLEVVDIAEIDGRLQIVLRRKQAKPVEAPSALGVSVADVVATKERLA